MEGEGVRWLPRHAVAAEAAAAVDTAAPQLRGPPFALWKLSKTIQLEHGEKTFHCQKYLQFSLTSGAIGRLRGLTPITEKVSVDEWKTTG